MWVELEVWVILEKMGTNTLETPADMDMEMLIVILETTKIQEEKIPLEILIVSTHKLKKMVT